MFLAGRPTIHLNNHIIIIIITLIVVILSLRKLIPFINRRKRFLITVNVSRNASSFFSFFNTNTQQSKTKPQTNLLRQHPRNPPSLLAARELRPASAQTQLAASPVTRGGAAQGCFIINSSRQPRLRWRWKINNLEAYISVAYIAQR